MVSSRPSPSACLTEGRDDDALADVGVADDVAGAGAFQVAGGGVVAHTVAGVGAQLPGLAVEFAVGVADLGDAMGVKARGIGRGDGALAQVVVGGAGLVPAQGVAGGGDGHGVVGDAAQVLEGGEHAPDHARGGAVGQRSAVAEDDRQALAVERLQVGGLIGH